MARLIVMPWLHQTPPAQCGNSLADSGTPFTSMVNVAFGGTANSSFRDRGRKSRLPGRLTKMAAQSGTARSNSGLPAWISYRPRLGNHTDDQTLRRDQRLDVPARDPAAWLFQGSNDNTNWTTLDSQSGQSFALRQQVNYYNISNTTAYRYYRLYIEARRRAKTIRRLANYRSMPTSGHLIPNGTYRVSNRNSQKETCRLGRRDQQMAPGLYNGVTTEAVSRNGRSPTWVRGQYQAIGVGSGRALDVPSKSKSQGTQLDIRS